MHRTLVKICGVTRTEDALAAARLGASFVGMVLHADSPRRISPPQARDIVAGLPGSVTAVGVFVNAPAELVRRTCQTVGLTHVQLHGGETSEYIASLAPIVCWKMIRADHELRRQLQMWSSSQASAIVLETAGAIGGSGMENDWPAIAAARGELGETPRLIAAGGLTPENVAGVVRLLRPWAVDVSSGVEGAVRGQKSVEKIESFIRAVRAADQSV